MNKRMLIMNMGSTSTKISVYDGYEKIWVESIVHPRADVEKYLKYKDQYEYRKEKVIQKVEEKGEKLEEFFAFVSRGGTIKPVSGGTYEINQKMIDDAWSGLYGEHPCNIGGEIAYELAKEYGVKAYTVDPPACSEICDEAKISGLPEIERYESFQMLNHRAMARKACVDKNVNYEDVNLIVVHMGGGISVAAHQRGKIIDVNNALAGDGPMAMERSGQLPTGDLIRLCYSGKYSEQEMIRKVNGRGGIVAYLNTTNALEIDERIKNGDEYALKITKALAYQVAKEIGGISTVLYGKVDGIVLTGGLANWTRLVDMLKERVSHLGEVLVYPGENEMESLAFGVMRCVEGEEEVKIYEG